MCKKYSLYFLEAFTLFETVCVLILLSFVSFMVLQKEKENQNIITLIPKEGVLLKADSLLKDVSFAYHQTQRLELPAPQTWGDYEIIFEAQAIKRHIYRLEARIFKEGKLYTSLITYSTPITP